MDNGITKDGHVLVWHDESILPNKCQDTGAAFPNDPMYPYVGKFIANLTLDQVKTLDCGSIRQPNFPLQLRYPGTRLATLAETFSFLSCADPNARVSLNIESKLDPEHPNRTVSAAEFVYRQREIFLRDTSLGGGKNYLKGYREKSGITYQSFDWRTIVGMRRADQDEGTFRLSALIDGETSEDLSSDKPSLWLAGLSLSSFPGKTTGERIARAAHYVGANVLSPAALASVSRFALPDEISSAEEKPEREEFTTLEMVQTAHDLGVEVKPWTVNDLGLVSKLVLEYGVDGIITDAPQDVRRWAMTEGSLPVAPRFSKTKVLKCLAEHNQVDSHSHLVHSAAINFVAPFPPEEEEPAQGSGKPGLLAQH